MTPDVTSNVAWRWTAAGGMVSLGFAPGDDTSEPLGVSGDGNVVVGISVNAAAAVSRRRQMGKSGSMRKLLGLAMALIAIAAAAPAAASSDPVVKTATDLIKAGKSAQAYALLRPQRDASASDPDYNYALGLAAMDSNHVTEAILAFQRVLAITPDQMQARAELARAYAMSGDIDTARREFDTVAGDPSIPDPVRQRFNTVVKRLDRTLKPGSNLTGFVEAGGGYDSNVNAATSAAQLGSGGDKTGHRNAGAVLSVAE